MLRPTIVILVAILTPACSKSGPTPTTKGSSVLSWKLADSDRVAIRSAVTSNASTKHVSYVAHPTSDTSVALALDVETATVAFKEDGKDVTHTAPIKLEAKASDPAGFALGPASCKGPHYQLAAPGAAPRAMVLTCYVHARRSQGDVGFQLYVYGDGTINDGQVKPAP
ncbi:MAG: hypothetical protein H6717_14790 [Polyangiaceae bacterium]|nr:hypothetical protein [Polyangiaceae bacterium]